MAKPFLQAEWRNLLMANYEADPAVLRRWLPCHTELDEWNGRHYLSLVGFLFRNTKVMGIRFPFHTDFEEVNLRFYVRYRDGAQWKRGVVFLKEIVPRRMITLIANRVYGENYATHPMRHSWKVVGNELQVSYAWKVGAEWNELSAQANREPAPLREGSEEAFITEHYWGYTRVSDQCTGVYEVRHAPWNIHTVQSYRVHCSVEALYGKELASAMASQPSSVFLAEGSPIQVMHGARL